MRKLVVVLLALAALAAPAAATAHPLGNFTTNRYAEVEVSGDRIYVLYVLDLAEIPTYQASGEVERLGQDAYAGALAADLARGVTLTVGGEPRSLRELRRELVFPQGVGGLRTTRLEVSYDAGPAAAGALVYRDANFPSRIGWKEVVVRAEGGARLESSTAPERSVSDRLRAYPDDLLRSPLDASEASATVEPGAAAGTPPLVGGTKLAAPARGAGAGEGGFAALIAEENLSAGVVLLSLLAALFWGAAHALTPGHGKAIVAAYLVGSRGTARQALLLGLIVTVTHTIGVFALGLVTLALSEFLVPEDLYPWLNLVSALLVVLVGLAVLRTRVRGRGHHHHHGHHHQHDGHHHHHHDPEPRGGLRGLLTVGVSGGLLPCPTALVVLLAAISLHRVGYGLLLIVAFSLGLAGAIAAIGLLAVTAKRTFRRLSLDGPLVRALPAVSALVILGLGIAMTVHSLPSVL